MQPTAAPSASASPGNPPVPDFSRGRGAPVLTVGIPAYNRPRLLAAALASIAAQDDPDIEVVVCDDGGLAETRRAVEESAIARIKLYVNRPPLGPVANWNRCIEVATGTWVTILHEDDLLYPWFWRSVRPRLREEVAALAVRCEQGPQPPPTPAEPRRVKSRTYAPAWFLKSSMTPFPGVVFPRALGLRLGGFDIRQGGLADYAFWYELARTGPIETLDIPAAFYRVNEGQWTERAWPEMLRRAHLLRLRIAREQLAGHPTLGRWIARFYTGRMARAYARRFAERPAGLARARAFERIPFHRLPSGWVWAWLQLLG